MSFKRFLIKSSGSPVPWSGTIYAILEKDIMGNIHVKLFEPVVQVMLFKEKAYRQCPDDLDRSQ